MNGRVVTGMPDVEYRRALGASASGLKLIRDCPARYRWRQAGTEHKSAYDFGHAVHSVVLGRGLDVEVVAQSSWQTKTAREAQEAAYAAGKAPLLEKDWERAQAAAAAVRDHPIAGPLMAGPGDSEVAVFWTDQQTGVECKALLDFVTERWGAVVIPDLKTTGSSANPRVFARDAANFGYHLPAAFYSDGWEIVTGESPRFLHVVVESKPPHLVSVVELDAESIDAGRRRYRDALDVYARCLESGEWYGYTEQVVETITLPRSHLYRRKEQARE